jgi:hypothetical protein
VRQIQSRFQDQLPDLGSCTLVTDLISGRPARYIRNKLIDDLVGSGLKPLAVPAQLSLTFPLGAAALVSFVRAAD